MNNDKPVVRPRRFSESELKRVQVEIINPYRLVLRCAQCGWGWSPMIRAGGRLPRNYSKCPGGCNHDGPSEGAAVALEKKSEVGLNTQRGNVDFGRAPDQVTGHAALGVVLETIHRDEYKKPSDDQIKAFDEIFRRGPLGSKMAPESICWLLSPEVQSMIKELDLKRLSERELKRQARTAMTPAKCSADADSENVFPELANARPETAA